MQEMFLIIYHELNFLQSHLLIISGLYGALKPLDAIKPYRLEMATKLNEINLMSFWQDEITDYINKVLAKHENKYLLNLGITRIFICSKSK